jgi:chromosome segregation ATPase
MSQPTEDRIKRIEDQQANFDKRLKEVEHQTDIGILKIEMQGVRADILQIRESQADQRDTLKEHGQHLKAIEDKQDAHTEVLGQIVNLSEGHTTRFDRIETRLESTATKDDITHLEGLIKQLLPKPPEGQP